MVGPEGSTLARVCRHIFRHSKWLLYILGKLRLSNWCYHLCPSRPCSPSGLCPLMVRDLSRELGELQQLQPVAMDPRRFHSWHVCRNICYDWRIVRVLCKLQLHTQPVFHLVQSCPHRHHNHPLCPSRCSRVQPTFRARPEWHGRCLLHVPRYVRRWQSYPREVQPLQLWRGERHTHFCPSSWRWTDFHSYRVFHHTSCNTEPCLGRQKAQRRNPTTRRP